MAHKPRMSKVAAKRRFAWQEGIYAANLRRPKQMSMRFWGRRLVIPSTRAVFERCNIVSSGDLRDAAQRLDAYASVAV